jgi:hypothetical protein
MPPVNMHPQSEQLVKCWIASACCMRQAHLNLEKLLFCTWRRILQTASSWLYDIIPSMLSPLRTSERAAHLVRMILLCKSSVGSLNFVDASLPINSERYVRI